MFTQTRSRLLVLTTVLAVTGAGCASRGATPPVAAPAPAPSAGTPAPAPQTTPAAKVALPDSILWFRTAVEYRAGTIQAYRLATAMLDRALADKAWTAALEQAGGDYAWKPPAVILDADETVLDNSELEERNARAGAAYSEERWAEWCREMKAPAVPGAVEFTQAARAKGVTVFYVTNRDATLEDVTRKNLAALGFPLDEARDTVLTKGERPDWSSEKSPRRQLIARDFRILLLIGDDFGDFVQGARSTLAARDDLHRKHGDMWGSKWIVLPNPMYGSWKTAALQ